ncbi:MAG TPA: chorismate mutase [Candidatus Limnocylindrales bacterium]|nr:chorismate mutase [Candidatus Limnocylindrales bacterium]
MNGTGREPDPARELEALRARIDEIDRRLVELLNERAELARGVGRAKLALGRRAIRDAAREREILVRVAMANAGPMPQADLLAIYRRLFAATRALEAGDRERERVRRVLDTEDPDDRRPA